MNARNGTLAAVAIFVLQACGTTGNEGWIRLKGAAVESDGRELQRCHLDLIDAATDEVLIGDAVAGHFDIRVYPRRPASSYAVTIRCNGFKETMRVGPFDGGAGDWTRPVELGDIVFRRIP